MRAKENEVVIMKRGSLVVRIYMNGVVEMNRYDYAVETAVVEMMGVPFERWRHAGVSFDDLTDKVSITVPLESDTDVYDWRGAYLKVRACLAARRMRG